MEEMNRQGLLLWLKALVESGNCQGVTWVDEEQGIFQIPWSNQKSRNWQKEDSSVFMEYAKHTCKYKPGDKIDFPRWKQNLKSAINKNRFIDRLRNYERLCRAKPFRVYRFLNERASKKKSDDTDEDNSEIVIDGQLGCHSDIRLAAGIIKEDVFLPESSTSTRSSFMSFTEGGSPFSHFPSMTSDSNLALSPDLPRSDFCDQPQGNIPIFNTIFDGKDSFSEDNLLNVNATIVEQLYVFSDHPIEVDNNLPVVDEGNQYSAVSSGTTKAISHSFGKKEGNDNHSQQFFQIQAHKPQPEQAHPHTSLEVMAVTCHYETPLTISVTDSQHHNFAPSSHDLGCYNPQQGVTYTMHVQPGTLKPEARFKNSGYPIHLQDLAHHTQEQKSERDSLKPIRITNLQKDKYQNEKRIQLQAKPLIASSSSSNRHEGAAIVPDMLNCSFSELESYNDFTSDRPSSMDTRDENCDRHSLSGSHFGAHREMSSDSRCESSIPRPVDNVTEDVMHVQVLYGTPHRTVKKVKLAPSRSSCRLFFGAVNTTTMQNAIQGEQDAEEVELPSVDDLEYTTNTKSVIRRVLKDMELGIVISYRNGDIYVERRCLPRVYLSDGVSTSESLPRSTKKRPDVETIAFDFNNNFRQAIERNQRNEGPVPKDHFLLTIGYEILPNDDSPTRQVPVYIVVRHVLAGSERYKILGASAIAPNPMCSDPNSFDKTIGLFKEIDLKK